MTQVIEGVPESITVDQVRTLVSALGLELEHLIELHIAYEGITAVVWATDANGDRYFVPGLSEGAQHHVSIKLLDD